MDVPRREPFGTPHLSTSLSRDARGTAPLCHRLATPRRRPQRVPSSTVSRSQSRRRWCYYPGVNACFKQSSRPPASGSAVAHIALLIVVLSPSSSAGAPSNTASFEAQLAEGTGLLGGRASSRSGKDSQRRQAERTSGSARLLLFRYGAPAGGKAPRCRLRVGGSGSPRTARACLPRLPGSRVGAA